MIDRGFASTAVAVIASRSLHACPLLTHILVDFPAARELIWCQVPSPPIKLNQRISDTVIVARVPIILRRMDNLRLAVYSV